MQKGPMMTLNWMRARGNIRGLVVWGLAGAVALGMAGAPAQAALISDDYQDDTAGQGPDDPELVSPANSEGDNIQAIVVDETTTTPTDPFTASTNNQSLYFEDNSDSGFHYVTYEGDNLTSGTLSFDYYHYAGSDPFLNFRLGQEPADEDGLIGNIGAQVLMEGSDRFRVNDDGSFAEADQTFAEGVSHSLDLSFDTGSDTYSITVDGTQVTTNSGANSTFGFSSDDLENINKLNLLGGLGSVTGTQSAVDNVEVVPEPASMALVGLGGLVLLSRGRRRG